MDYRRWKYLVLFILCCLPLWAGAVEVIVKYEAVSLRRDIASDTLGAVVRSGQKLKVLNKLGRWFYIETSNKEVGWIFEDLVELDLTTYSPISPVNLTPQQIFVLTTKEIPKIGQILAYQWIPSGEKIIYLTRTEEGEIKVNLTSADIKETSFSSIFTFTEPKSRFLPENQQNFNVGLSLSTDSQKLLIGGSILRLLFLNDKFEVQRQERIKVRFDDELYLLPTFSPKSDRAIAYNLVSEELNGLVNNLCLISAKKRDYEIVARGRLDWNESPVWAPDGLSFLYGAEGKIYLVNEHLQIKEFASGEHFRFSPDGKTIIYSRKKEIYLKPIDSKKEEVLKTFGDYPAWNPKRNIFLYENAGLWLEDITGPEKKRLGSSIIRPSWSPQGDKLLGQASGESLVVIYLAEVLDIDYVYQLDLGQKDGLKEGMILSVYQPQVGLREQTVGYNQESWQGFIRIIKALDKKSLVKQEKMTRIIGQEEVVVLPSLNKLGRLVRITNNYSSPAKKEKWNLSSAAIPQKLSSMRSGGK